MVEISDYNTTYIKVNNNNADIFFLAKDGLVVSGVGGNVVLVTSSNSSYTYFFSNIKSPSKTTLDELVVAVRVFIDNV